MYNASKRNSAGSTPRRKYNTQHSTRTNAQQSKDPVYELHNTIMTVTTVIQYVGKKLRSVTVRCIDDNIRMNRSPFSNNFFGKGYHRTIYSETQTTTGIE